MFWYQNKIPTRILDINCYLHTFTKCPLMCVNHLSFVKVTSLTRRSKLSLWVLFLLIFNRLYIICKSYVLGWLYGYDRPSLHMVKFQWLFRVPCGECPIRHPPWRAAIMVRQCSYSEPEYDYSVASMSWNYIRIYSKRNSQKKNHFVRLLWTSYFLSGVSKILYNNIMSTFS